MMRLPRPPHIGNLLLAWLLSAQSPAAFADIATEAEQHGDIDVGVALEPAAQHGHANAAVRIRALDLAPGFWVPRWMVRLALEQDLPRMLRALRVDSEAARSRVAAASLETRH